MGRSRAHDTFFVKDRLISESRDNLLYEMRKYALNSASVL